MVSGKKTCLFKSRTFVQVRIARYLQDEGWSSADIESVEFPNGKSVLITKTSGQRVLARWVIPPPRPSYVRIVSYPDNKTSDKGVNDMSVQQNGEEMLRGQLMETILSSGLSYKETISALDYVLTALRNKGGNLLDGVNIQEVAMQKQSSRRLL